MIVNRDQEIDISRQRSELYKQIEIRLTEVKKIEELLESLPAVRSIPRVHSVAAAPIPEPQVLTVPDQETRGPNGTKRREHSHCTGALREVLGACRAFQESTFNSLQVRQLVSGRSINTVCSVLLGLTRRGLLERLEKQKTDTTYRALYRYRNAADCPVRGKKGKKRIKRVFKTHELTATVRAAVEKFNGGQFTAKQLVGVMEPIQSDARSVRFILKGFVTAGSLSTSLSPDNQKPYLYWKPTVNPTVP